jgi:hypothetical protein
MAAVGGCGSDSKTAGAPYAPSAVTAAVPTAVSSQQPATQSAKASGTAGAQPGEVASKPETPLDSSAQAIGASRHPNLQWKRYAAFENDLADALAVPKSELCTELGKASCVRGVHLAPLGGHNPFETGLLESSAEPLATTPTVVDRIVLSACSARVQLDQAAPPADAKLFGALDLAKPAPGPNAEATRSVIAQLYRRLLARDADESELATVAKLTVDAQGQPVAARDFALSACFVVATTTESLFF